MINKCIRILSLTLLVGLLLCTTVYADTGNVAGAIESTWTTAAVQIKEVVNKVVFPAINMILCVFFFGKLALAYFDYRKQGQFDWVAPAMLFACLVFSMTAPLYIWTVLGI
ncbi:MAG: DUF3852 domain-containing protein [Eubacteriales bacterium]